MHLESPAGYDHRRARGRFERLAERIHAETYDGVSDVLRRHYAGRPPSWWIRYFDYL